MTLDEARELVVLHHGFVNDQFPLPKDPVFFESEKSRCPCGTRLYILCAESIEFYPAHFVCPACKRVTEIKKGGA